jgi:cytosine/adenosine deaminase-related metal-dependent hydrolase
MAATLIHDTTIVTADEAGSILYDAALFVLDGRIAALGPTTELIARWRRLFERRPELPRPPGFYVGAR